MLPNLLLRQSLIVSRPSARGFSTLIFQTNARWSSSLAGNSLITNGKTTSCYGFMQHHQQQQQRYYTPMTKEEEEREKERVSKLSTFKREQELRKLNREILRLSMLKGINTGDLYSVKGKYKMLLNEYGGPMMVWYGFVWLASGALVYTLATVGGMDVMAILDKFDNFTGWEMSAKVDPEMGKLGMVIILNELLEPIRLPIVVMTVKPVCDALFPPKV